MKCFLFAFFVYIQFRSIGFLGRLYLLLPHKFHLDQMAKITFRGHGILQSIHHPSLYNNKLFSAPILLPPKLPSAKLYNMPKRDNLSNRFLFFAVNWKFLAFTFGCIRNKNSPRAPQQEFRPIVGDILSPLFIFYSGLPTQFNNNKVTRNLRVLSQELSAALKSTLFFALDFLVKDCD